MSGIQQGLLASYAGSTPSTLLTGLTAYWKLDESSGNAADSKGTNTGVNNGTVAFASAKINNGASFDDTRRFFDCGATGEINTASFSFSAWFKTAKTTEQYLFSNMGDNTNEWCLIALSTGSADKLNLYFNDKVSKGWHAGTTTVTDNAWHHVVVTVDSSTILMYLDGNTGTPEKTVSTANALSTSALTSQIGMRRHDTPVYYPPFSGLIDEVATWNRVLTTAEVTELYNSGNGVQYPF